MIRSTRMLVLDFQWMAKESSSLKSFHRNHSQSIDYSQVRKVELKLPEESLLPLVYMQPGSVFFLT